MKNIAQIASNTIRRPNGKSVFVLDGNTQDIIKQILAADRVAGADTKLFAVHLKGKNLMETLENVWSFVKLHIRYELDPANTQYVKLPGRTFHEKFADCKSYSIFIASILQNLQIPYKYRFVSYSTSEVYTHVYIIIPQCGKYIVLDCCMDAFNTEKSFTYKQDHNMTKIYRLSGIGCPDNRVAGNLDLGDPEHLTEGVLDLMIAEQNLEIRKNNIERVEGIGSLTAEKIQDALDVVRDAKENLHDEEALAVIEHEAANGGYSNAHEIHGIGDIGKKSAKRAEKKAARKEKRAVKKAANGGKTKLGKFLKKAATTVKKGAKALVKVATAPQRLGIKLVLEGLLPKMAPLFLYLFANDPSKLTETARKKRKKSESIANFIVNVIGMKRAHFMGIVRNGIAKKFGKQPEAVLAGSLTGQSVSGIGDIGIIDDIVKVGTEVLSKLMSLFGKKGAPSIEADDVPHPEQDFNTATPAEKQQLAASIKKDDESQEFEAGGKKAGMCK